MAQRLKTLSRVLSNPSGEDVPSVVKAAGLKRMVPKSASDTILEELAASKTKSKQKGGRRSILERCGCL